MEVETETMVEKREIINNVMCLLTDTDGTPLGSPMYLPQNAGPQHLNQIVNKLQNNEEKLPYAFYISDEELIAPLETYLQKNKGHAEIVLSVAFSLDGRQLASGSGDTSVQFWDLTTQTPLYTCKGLTFKNVKLIQELVLCIAWSLDGKYLVSGSKAGELICWDPQTGKSLGNPLTFIDSIANFHYLKIQTEKLDALNIE
ncbi:Notchless protein-like protein [Vigna angularis]|uniref:Notchless protein-like protein n=1 Tax=Phaseolus angularis TaxID=3914 RepID=A0A8T0JY81_PHAAN|nr:Notchless protein-like protein [Vigna angularis]